MPINLPGVPFKLTPQDMGGFDLGEALKQGLNINKQFQEARTLPKKLAEELLQAKLKTKHDETINQYLPRSEEARIGESESSIALKHLQTEKALMELRRAKEFQKLLSGGNAANQSTNGEISNPSYKETLNKPRTNGIQAIDDFSDNGMPAGSPGIAKSASAYDTFPGRRNKPPTEAAWPEQNESPVVNEETPNYQETIKTAATLPKNTRIISPGNPQLAHINKLYEDNPQYRKEFESQGFKKSVSIKSDPSSGEAFVVTKHPNGMVTAEAINVGKSPGEIAQEKQEGKYRGTTYGDAVDASMALSDRSENLNRLAEGIENNPDAQNVIGPVNQSIAKWFGNPEDKAYLGEVMSATGNIVLDAAKNIKGSFTGRDQTLINSMKPNPSDPYWVFVGKLKGMAELTDLAKQRMDLYAEAVHNGIAPHKALEIAKKSTDITKIGDRYSKLIQIAKQREALKEGKLPSFHSKSEADSFLNSLTPREKVKLLNLKR